MFLLQHPSSQRAVLFITGMELLPRHLLIPWTFHEVGLGLPGDKSKVQERKNLIQIDHIAPLHRDLCEDLGHWHLCMKVQVLGAIERPKQLLS